MAEPVQLLGALEPRDGWSAEGCPMAATLELLGTRSAFLLLREAFYGATRFDEFTRRAELSDPATAAHLRELVAAGLLEREDYREPGQRTRQRYLLTEKGADVFPIFVALMRWGGRWIEGHDGVELRHDGCGEPVEAVLRCAAGHPVAAPAEVALAARPRRTTAT
jgi:DNA-binding HxlR family transcriptional regulator